MRCKEDFYQDMIGSDGCIDDCGEGMFGNPNLG
jgi:hypothetical protein